MIDVAHSSETLEGRMWAALEACGVGLLGLTKSGLHPQATAVFVDRRRRRLWFVTPADSDLVRSVGDGGAAMFTAQGEGLLASISGNLTQEFDSRRLARVWTAAASAWRPQGSGAPALALLRMDCVDAEVSLPDLGMARFTWELARPRFRGKSPRAAGALQPTLH
ncbi:MAG: pyridoxamine 5'-phosphate oxidase family protein [Phenylobacterium sp.]